MFIVSLRYTRPLEEVDALLAQHVEWLRAGHAAGHFLAWGRKIPRDGGILFMRAESRTDAEALAVEDPFVKGGVAEIEVIEFAAGFAGPGLEALLA
ncbi:MAG: hypothetical protein IT551_08920 [Novosphingobium sp.]|nr:hypothetical protein [Novosphingobium sp.]